MTTEHHDFWADLPEWENRYDPGQILDSWREAEELFAPLAKLAECSGNEALETAVYSAENRVAAQVRRWEEEVRGLLKENMREGRLTPLRGGALPAPAPRGDFALRAARKGRAPRGARPRDPSCATCTDRAWRIGVNTSAGSRGRSG